MTEDDYRRFVAEQRIKAQQHLGMLLSEWRGELWPGLGPDPIEREDRHKRWMREAAIYGYFGAGTMMPRWIYGGICGA